MTEQTSDKGRRSELLARLRRATEYCSYIHPSELDGLERDLTPRPSLAASEVIPAYEGRTIGAGKRARLIALLDEWIKEADAASPEERAAEQANFEAVMESIGRRSPLPPPTPAINAANPERRSSLEHSEVKPDGSSESVVEEGSRIHGSALCNELRAGGAECGTRDAGSRADGEGENESRDVAQAGGGTLVPSSPTPASGETPPIGATAEKRAEFWKRAFAACSESKVKLERELRKREMEMPDYKQCCDLREKAERDLAAAQSATAASEQLVAEYRRGYQDGLDDRAKIASTDDTSKAKP